jgi:hypothetical protein
MTNKMKLVLTSAEVKALLNAAALVLADEFDGSAPQRKALERAHTKLVDLAVVPDPAPNQHYRDCFKHKKLPSSPTTEDCYGDGWFRCTECWRYTT